MAKKLHIQRTVIILVFAVFNVIPVFGEIDPEYHTPEEYGEALTRFALDYPALCKLDSIGHSQQFGRPIWSLKISDNPYTEEDEIAVLYVAVHHGCEVMGGETILHMIGNLLENYGSDPEITAWIDDYEIFFVPLLNPDGLFAVTEDINLFWRKTARDIDGDGIYYEFIGGGWWTDDHEGIDLNRNYDWNWTFGGSADPWDYLHRGTEPFSESESRAVRDLAIEQRFTAALSFHSYGEIIMYPWFGPEGVTPDNDVYDQLALDLAVRFPGDDGTTYGSSHQTALTGYFSNWIYGALGTLSFRVELLPFPDFIPPGEELEWRAELYSEAAKYLFQRIGQSGVTGHVTDGVSGEPVYANVEITDRISSAVDPRYNDPLSGRYTRLLPPGDYTVSAEAEGYVPVLEDVNVTDGPITVLDIELEPAAGVRKNVPADDYDLLLDCSPNPFNDAIRVNYTLEKPGALTLTVYDIQGRRIDTLAGGHHSAGNHRLVWQAGTIAGGVYLVQMKSGEETLTKKVVYIK